MGLCAALPAQVLSAAVPWEQGLCPALCPTPGPYSRSRWAQCPAGAAGQGHEQYEAAF